MQWPMQQVEVSGNNSQWQPSTMGVAEQTSKETENPEAGSARELKKSRKDTTESTRARYEMRSTYPEVTSAVTVCNGDVRPHAHAKMLSGVASAGQALE